VIDGEYKSPPNAPVKPGYPDRVVQIFSSL